MDSQQSLLYSPLIIVIFITILPTFITISCFLFALHYKHIDLNHHFPMLHDVMTQLPESRVYSVGMNLVAWLALPIFLIIDRILKLKCKMEKCHNEVKVYCLRWIMNIFGGFAFFSLLGLSSVNVKENRTMHNVCSHVFIFSLMIYFIIIEYEMFKAKLEVPPSHKVLSYFGPILHLFSQYLDRNGNDSHLLTIAGIFEFLVIPSICIRFFLMWKTLPSNGILVRHKKET